MTVDVVTRDGSQEHLSGAAVTELMSGLRAAYDPDNLFQVNNNIVPAP